MAQHTGPTHCSHALVKPRGTPAAAAAAARGGGWRGLDVPPGVRVGRYEGTVVGEGVGGDQREEVQLHGRRVRGEGEWGRCGEVDGRSKGAGKSQGDRAGFREQLTGQGQWCSQQQRPLDRARQSMELEMMAGETAAYVASAQRVLYEVA